MSIPLTLVDTRHHRPYSEAAFRCVLAIERERCRRSGRPLVLVLIDTDGALNHRLARKVFATLSRCLRETDVVGWYLDGGVAGAVLTEVTAETATDVGALVVGRLSSAFRAALPRWLAGRVRVRLSLNPELLSGGVACSS